MKNEKKGNRGAIEADLELSVGSLMGKQSVRTTFRLPQQVIDLLSAVSAQLGLKQKSLFDQLVEDRTILDQVANEARNRQHSPQGRRSKTFVISKNSLEALEHVARLRQMPRDLLVEVSIYRLLPLIDKEQKKHEVRKALLLDLQAYLDQGKKILHKTGRFLGPDDQQFQKMAELVAHCKKNVADLEEQVEKGNILEYLNSRMGR